MSLKILLLVVLATFLFSGKVEADTVKDVCGCELHKSLKLYEDHEVIHAFPATDKTFGMIYLVIRLLVVDEFDQYSGLSFIVGSTPEKSLGKIGPLLIVETLKKVGDSYYVHVNYRYQISPEDLIQAYSQLYGQEVKAK